MPSSCSSQLVLAALVASVTLHAQETETSRGGMHALQAASSRPGAVDPWLRAELDRLGDGGRAKVYFVLRQRFDAEGFRTRTKSQPLAQRRQLVVAALRDHATDSQRELLAAAERERIEGRCSSPTTNWLGNFVQLEATVAAIERLAALPCVLSAHLDTTPRHEEVADAAQPVEDPGHGASHAAHGLDAPIACAATNPAPGDGPVQTRAFVAWAYGFRGQGVLVANVDGGISSHSDLDARRWTNTGEIANNGIDDDQNGFVDDVHGFAFDLGSAAIDDGGGHGTMTAGLLVGDGSCSGIAWGQAPAANVMTCRTLSETSQWNAIQYALAMGADVQTSSFSYKANFTPPPNYLVHRDVAAATLAAGLIRVNSSGNDGAAANDGASSLRVPCNIAAPACAPSPYLDPAQSSGGISGVLAVGAYRVPQNAIDVVSPHGPFAWSLADVQQNVPAYPASQWDAARHDDYPWQNGARQGLLKPDVLGPTGNTTTSGAPCRTTTFSGTSNAAPTVAGVIALWKCANPSLTPEDVAMIVHQTAQDLGPVAGKENRYGAGLVDAERGLRRALCVHRVDHESAWAVDHPIAAGPVHLAIDGVPNSLAVVVVGLQRMPLSFGSLQLGVGPGLDVVFGGVTDSFGELQSTAGTGPWLQGLRLATQAVLLDQTHTGLVLDSNVVEIAFR